MWCFFLIFIFNAFFQVAIYQLMSEAFDLTEAFSNKPGRKWRAAYQWLLWRPYLMFVPFGYVIFLLVASLIGLVHIFIELFKTVKADLNISKDIRRK